MATTLPKTISSTLGVFRGVRRQSSDAYKFQKSVPEGNWRFRGQNQQPSSLSLTPALLAGRTGKYKHRVFPSLLQWLLSLLEESMLPLLLYWLSSRANQLSMLCRFWAATSHFFFSCEMKFPYNRPEVVANQGRAQSFAQSFYHSLVSEQKYDIGIKLHVPDGILCKAAGLYQWPVRGKGVCSDLNQTA